MRFRAFGVLLIVLVIVSTAFAQAEQLTYGAFTSNTLDSETPARFYEFEATTGDFISAEVIALNTTLDPQLSLLSSGDAALAISNDDPFQPGSNDARLTYLIPADGVYTLLVQSENATSGQFVLRLDQLPPREATALSEGIVTPVTVTPDIPVAAFTFDSATATTITASSPAAGVGFVMEVQSSDGQTIAVQRGPLITEATTTVAPNSGTYTLLIKTLRSNQSATLEIVFGDAGTDTTTEQITAVTPEATSEDETTTAAADATTETTDSSSDNTAPADAANPAITGGAEATGTPAGGDTTLADDSRTAAENAPENRCTVVPEGTGGVNVRALPSTDSAVISSIPPGEYRFAEATDGAWIRLQGGGWVSSGVVTQSDNCAAIMDSVVSPITQTQQAISPTAAPESESVDPIGSRN